MSLKEEILERLDSKKVRSVVVEKNYTEHGFPAILVEVVFKAKNNVWVEHTFTFAKKNSMDNGHMADIIASYIKDKNGKAKH